MTQYIVTGKEFTEKVALSGAVDIVGKLAQVKISNHDQSFTVYGVGKVQSITWDTDGKGTICFATDETIGWDSGNDLIKVVY